MCEEKKKREKKRLAAQQRGCNNEVCAVSPHRQRLAAEEMHEDIASLTRHLRCHTSSVTSLRSITYVCSSFVQATHAQLLACCACEGEMRALGCRVRTRVARAGAQRVVRVRGCVGGEGREGGGGLILAIIFFLNIKRERYISTRVGVQFRSLAPRRSSCQFQ